MGPKIRSAALLYTSGQSDFDAFQEWLTTISWDHIDELEPAERDAVLAMENMVAEFTGGHLLEGALKESIRAMLRIPQLTVVTMTATEAPSAVTMTGSGTTLTQAEFLEALA